MVVFSKYINGQRGAQLLLDTDGFLYTRRKDRDTPNTSTWRCQKYRTKKCPAHVFLDYGHHSLSSGPKSHSPDPDNLVAEKTEFRAELKRKVADEYLSATQTLLTEALSTCPPEINVQRGGTKTWVPRETCPKITSNKIRICQTLQSTYLNRLRPSFGLPLWHC